MPELNRDGTRNVVQPSPLRHVRRPPGWTPPEPLEPLFTPRLDLQLCSRCDSREWAVAVGEGRFRVSLCFECADEELDRICCWERTWFGSCKDPYRKFKPKVPRYL